jgi:hypothetical protein
VLFLIIRVYWCMCIVCANKHLVVCVVWWGGGILIVTAALEASNNEVC